MDILYPLRRIHGKIHDAVACHRLHQEYKKRLQETPNSIFLVLTPNHENLGDHAITLAEITLLDQAGINCIEITGEKLNELNRHNLLGAFNGLPIIVHGGGFLGTLWKSAEYLLRDIILSNPKSEILIFPNTIFYENSEWGNDEFQKSIEIYNRHQKLTIFAREKTSFDLMRKSYHNVKLVPDAALSLNKSNHNMQRRGCLLCLRSDPEKTRTEDQEQLIRSQAESLFPSTVSDTDMISACSVPISQREQILKDKFRQFSLAELVITDRLHGMIFCAITGTPCIVIDSKSPKVRGCYEWIKDLEYIRFADTPSSITEEYQKIPKSCHVYDNSHLNSYYQELVEEVLRAIKES